MKKENQTNPLATIAEVIKLNGKGYMLRLYDSIVRLRLEGEFGSLEEWKTALKTGAQEAIYKTLYCFLHDLVREEVFKNDYALYYEQAKKEDTAYILDAITMQINKATAQKVKPAAIEDLSEDEKKKVIQGIIIAVFAIYGFINMLCSLGTLAYPYLNTIHSQIFSDKE